jgi:hypothetical protein
MGGRGSEHKQGNELILRFVLDKQGDSVDSMKGGILTSYEKWPLNWGPNTVEQLELEEPQ